MPTCPRCDATTGEGDRFCLNCGRALTEAAAVARRQAIRDPDATDTSLPVAAARAPGPVELVACPQCGGSNAARRRWCGRCGASLLGDNDLAVPEPAFGPSMEPDWQEEPGWDPGAQTPAPSRGGWRRRGIAIAVVGFGAVVGTALGVAAGTGMGPFASVEPVPFDPDAYPDAPERLGPATAGSSSTAPPDGARAFGPEMTVDGDLTSAWIPDGEERGALLRHGFVAPVWIDRIEIATGDQLDETTFAASGKVTEVLVDLGAQRLDVTLAGMDGVQLVRLPEPVLADEVTWEVTDTSGDVGAVSEVRYVGWPADEEDRRAFRERQ